MSISVCIPTYRRPALLEECVKSVFANEIRPIEIIVSDDAHEQHVQARMEATRCPDGITLRYVPNSVGRGQAANVRNAFGHAQHERIVLIHDDDLFVDGGIDAMGRAWDDAHGQVDAVYGRQYIADSSGIIDAPATTVNDVNYFKVQPAGAQPSPLWAALVQQFPNNSMMIRRSIVERIGYPDESEVGRQPVDLHFGIRYALASRLPFVMIHNYTAVYRRSEFSILRGPKPNAKEDGHLGFEHLLSVAVQNKVEKEAMDIAKARFAAAAVRGYLAERRLSRATSTLAQNLFHMNISWLGRFRLAAAIMGASVGVDLLFGGGRQ
jgi:GT2 family glycosyltransferase